MRAGQGLLPGQGKRRFILCTNKEMEHKHAHGCGPVGDGALSKTAETHFAAWHIADLKSLYFRVIL